MYCHHKSPPPPTWGASPPCPLPPPPFASYRLTHFFHPALQPCKMRHPTGCTTPIAKPSLNLHSTFTQPSLNLHSTFTQRACSHYKHRKFSTLQIHTTFAVFVQAANCAQAPSAYSLCHILAFKATMWQRL